MTRIDAADIARGVARAFMDAHQPVLTELPLANGRRADVVALDRGGLVTVVEVKSSRADFLADHKWPDYLPFCDRFFFAVASDFPLDLLPAGEGLILADRYAGEIIRDAVLRPLPAARRKAMLIRFARVAATRLQTLLDPAP